MFALISPNEEAWSISTMTESGSMTPPVLLGQRVAQVSAAEFPVAPPLFWMACGNDVRAETHYYDSNAKQIKSKPY